MFTEKHHDAIARVIAHAAMGNAWRGVYRIAEVSMMLKGVAEVKAQLSILFTADNPSFKPDLFAKACQGKEVAAMDWDKAETHFTDVLEEYKELVGTPGVNVIFAMVRTFDPLLKRFKAGERTKDLYDAMMGVQ